MSTFELTNKTNSYKEELYIESTNEGLHIEISDDDYMTYGSVVFKLTKDQKEILIKVLQGEVESYYE